MGDTLSMEITHWLSCVAGVRYPMPRNYDRWHVARRFIWIAYADAVNAAFLLELGSLMIRMTRSTIDLGIVCACSCAMGYILQFVLKSAIFRKRKKLFVKLFEEIRAVSRELNRNPLHGEYLRFYDEAYLRTVRIAVVKGVVEVAGASSLIIIFIVRSNVIGVPKDLKTPALTWTPYDNSRNPVYSLTCLFELIVFVSVTLKNEVMDLLFQLMVMVPTIQLRYLAELLEIVVNDADDAREVRTDRPDLDPAIPETAELKRKFAWWVSYHQRILSVVQELRAISSPYLAVNYLCTLSLLTFAGIAAISSTSWTIYQQTIINAIMISNTVQLYIISLTGDWLRETSETAADNGYSGCLFSDGGHKLRKNYLFVCARAKQSLQIRFAGINTLNTGTFGALIRLTLTYFVTIVQLHNASVTVK